MALTGQHFVEKASAWAAGVLHTAPRQNHVLMLRASTPLPPDTQALARATAIYAGQQVLTSDEFIALEWLACFARSGRHLLMCHALRLLDGWNHVRRPANGIEAEAAILGRLVFSAGQCAALLPKDQHTSLSMAMQSQVNRLLRLKTSDATQNRIKAMALLGAADVLQKALPLQTEAMQLLEQSLPHLIASDGGPLNDALPDYVIWLHALFANPEIQFAPKARNALDRSRPFLSMLLGSDGRYCFDAKIHPLAAKHVAAPLRLAPVSHVAHLAAGKSVAIAIPGQLHHTTQLSISSNGHAILDAGLFLHSSNDVQSVQALESDASEDGQWFRQITSDRQRTVFLSAKGDDLRIEDQLHSLTTPSWMRLSISDHAKVSVARNGTQASIALDGRNLWQLTVRGAELKAPAQGNQCLAKATGSRVNWALKRINRSTTRHGKAELPELPFELEIRQPRR